MFRVLYILSVHRALCVAPVPAIPPAPVASTSRLSKFNRLYANARFTNGGHPPATSNAAQKMDTARHYLPYSLVRKAVQRQREQRLQAINRRRHQARGKDLAVIRPQTSAMLDTSAEVVAHDKAEMRQSSASQSSEYAKQSGRRGRVQQNHQRPIYGRRRPYRPWLRPQQVLA